jgi:hypothetical protein
MRLDLILARLQVLLYGIIASTDQITGSGRIDIPQIVNPNIILVSELS